MVKIEPSWKIVLEDYFKTVDFKSLTTFVKNKYKSKKIIYPKPELVFNAFNLTPIDKLKVVILGQDPYHNPNQAMGLSFSVPKNITNPPSLKNIFKEIENEYQQKSLAETVYQGDLSNWAEQGIFLLNSVLTVEKNSPASHAKKGWEGFTDYVIKQISLKKSGVVFMLWGNYAKNKIGLIDSKKHLILTTSHPSPFSASYGFFNCNHFKLCNEYLEKHKNAPIKW